MSTDAPAVPAGRFSRFFPWTRDLRTAQIVRFSVAATTAAVIAFAGAWPLSFVCPVLTVVLLANKIPGFTHRTWIAIFYVLGAMLLGLVFVLFLHPYPAVFVLTIGLAFFNIYYFINRGGSFVFGLICLLSIIILPILTTQHEQLAMLFALYFGLSASLAVIIFIVANVLFPDPPGSPEPPDAHFEPGYSETAAKAALKSTLAIMPLVILFNWFEFTAEILTIVYAGILGLTAQSAAGWEFGKKMFKATLIGGFASLVIYWLLVAVPELHFLMVLWFVTMMIFASVIFSDHPLSKYAGSATTAMTILIFFSLGAEANNFGKIVIRIVLMGAAAVYVWAAFAVIDRFLLREKPVD